MINYCHEAKESLHVYFMNKKAAEKIEESEKINAV